ncbi:hypothetical protein BDN70DRAFT_937414 [Pholiota conissans]|uniref:Uncharacterized protein n=1 Tax=Pholiota conissans TaxID=109636 RepID=A0A9P5YQ84_9AGAR|nr:hypothetical protein BDN70DRAFT_937414 [Pholiota conissans]
MPMTRQTAKRIKSAATVTDEHPLGPIAERDPPVESSSDSDNSSDFEPAPVRAAEELAPSSFNERVIQSAPPSPPPTVAKRKRGRKAKALVEDDSEVDAPPTKITYILTILSAQEANKPVSKRQPVSDSMELAINEPWDTVKAQLLAKIDTALNPTFLDFDDFTTMFFIMRVLPKPGMALSTQENYASLLLRVNNLASKTPTVNITIQQKQGRGPTANKEKENVPAAASAMEAAGEGKAAKKKKEPTILSGNVNRALNVQKLQDHWRCTIRQPGTCIGAYCYVFPDTQVHLPLNHERLECWSSAMLKNDGSSTVEKPPNHRLFDPEGPLRQSPVIQRRIDAQNSLKAQPASQQPVIVFGDQFADLFRNAGVSRSEPSAHQPIAGSFQPSSTLLNPTIRDVGPDMPIAQFCNSFGLQPAVLEKLEENAYDFARNLCFITLENLTEMGFKLGQKAALQDAIERWSVPRIA